MGKLHLVGFKGLYYLVRNFSRKVYLIFTKKYHTEFIFCFTILNKTFAVTYNHVAEEWNTDGKLEIIVLKEVKQ